MKKALCFVVTMLFVLSIGMQTFARSAVYSETVEKSMFSVVDANKSEIFDISKKIWDLKEEGLKEVKSSALLEDSLEKHGFKVQRGVTGIDPTTNKKVDFPTAFMATYEGAAGGPTVGIMVEYDALPNGHACGHNLISESGLAAALALQEALKTTPGKVVVYGTPAEETSGSKVHMLAAGLMKNIDVMFEVHGGSYWSAELNVKAMIWPKYDKDGLVFKGISSHASAAPAAGRSALDGAILAGIGMEFLREHMLETDRVHYAILDGGKAANVVPNYTKVDLMVRADTTPELYDLTKRVENIIKGAALMTGTEAFYEWDAPLLNAVPVPELWKFVAKTGPAAGVAENLFQVNTKAGGSTDAGNVGNEVPTTNITFPVAADNPPPGHSDAFNAAAGSEFGMNSSLTAGKLMAVSAYRLLTDPAQLAKIKEEFAKNRK